MTFLGSNVGVGEKIKHLFPAEQKKNSDKVAAMALFMDKTLQWRGSRTPRCCLRSQTTRSWPSSWVSCTLELSIWDSRCWSSIRILERDDCQKFFVRLFSTDWLTRDEAYGNIPSEWKSYTAFIGQEMEQCQVDKNHPKPFSQQRIRSMALVNLSRPWKILRKRRPR